ncbi:MAG: hypothetical protein ACR2KM_08745 [Gemmatimonadaceae bacterium]
MPRTAKFETPAEPHQPEIPPCGLYRLRNVVRPRRAGYLDDRTPPTCAAGHEIHSNTHPCHGSVVVWCNHRDQNAGINCAATTVPQICGVPLFVEYQSDGVFVIDLDETEARGIQRERLKASDVRRMLGVVIRDSRKSA